MFARRTAALIAICLLAFLPLASVAQPKTAGETVYVTKTGE